MTSCPMGAARKEKQPLFFSPLAVEAQTLLASFQALAELQRVPAAACARIPPPRPLHVRLTKAFTGSSKGHAGRRLASSYLSGRRNVDTPVGNWV